MPLVKMSGLFPRAGFLYFNKDCGGFVLQQVYLFTPGFVDELAQTRINPRQQGYK
jgi:hypothetical protein